MMTREELIDHWSQQMADDIWDRPAIETREEMRYALRQAMHSIMWAADRGIEPAHVHEWAEVTTMGSQERVFLCVGPLGRPCGITRTEPLDPKVIPRNPWEPCGCDATGACGRCSAQKCWLVEVVLENELFGKTIYYLRRNGGATKHTLGTDPVAATRYPSRTAAETDVTSLGLPHDHYVPVEHVFL